MSKSKKISKKLIDKIKLLKKILTNKKIYYVMWILFLILLWLYIWSINDKYLFYRNFHWKYRFFHIYHLAEKIKYNFYIVSWLLSMLITIKILSIFYLKYKFQNIIKNKIFKIIFVYIVYILFVFLLVFLELKTKILLIITPLIVYYTFQICKYIQETKENFKYKFLIDSRYFFLWALILLIYTPIFIYFKNQDIAEQLSIYAYYFLVIWVIYEIILWFIKK